MIRTRTLYVMASHTETGMGRIIRAVSRYEYNHVSLTLDSSLRLWYSFARFRQDTPLYGGLVREDAERFCSTGDAWVRIYQVQIPEKKARDLEEILDQAGKPDCGMIYNHFDVLARAVGSQLSIPGCHTCLSFACEVLDATYGSIRDLCQALEDRKIYEGSLTGLLGDSGSREGEYYDPLGLLRGTALTVRQLGTLCSRTISQGIRIYLEYYSRRTVH